MLWHQLSIDNAPLIRCAKPQFNRVEAASPLSRPFHKYHSVRIVLSILIGILLFKRLQHIVKIIHGLRRFQPYVVQPILAESNPVST
ncbi:hypothetical protein D3C77_219800 [compost metagenome]